MKDRSFKTFDLEREEWARVGGVCPVDERYFFKLGSFV